VLALCTGCSIDPFNNSVSSSQYGAKSTPASTPYREQQSGHQTTQPHIVDIQVNSITSSGAIIAWTTDKPSFGDLQWGRTTDYEFTAQAGEPALQQSVNLTGLKPNTIYHYSVLLKDQRGAQVVSQDQTFRTLEPIYIRPLVISHISIAKITGAAATIIWTTDEPATGRVEYGKTVLYGSTPSVNGSYSYNHSLDLEPLSPGTTYHYRVLSQDRSGNEAASADQVFTTSDPRDVTAPVISDITITNVTHASATISWITSEFARSHVEYDTDLSYRNTTAPGNGTVHNVTLDNLDISATYHFRIKSTDPAGNVSTSPDEIFVTSTPPRMLGTTPSQRGSCGCRSR
jgi:hypothetical protein